MNSIARSSLIGAGVGAGLMFILDPDRGARRRALARDQMTRAVRKTRDAAEATRRDVGSRIGSFTARKRALLDDSEADDRTICERIRAELGRVSSHPRAITVGATGGWVTLGGDVIAREHSSILSAIASVRGVEGVKNNLTVHQDSRSMPAPQGTSTRLGQWTTWLRSGWSPTAVLIVSAGTAALAASMARANRAS